MSIRSLITFDIQKNERFYHIMVPNGAPYDEAREALFDVISIIDEQQKATKEKEATTEEVAPEVAEVAS